MRLIFTRGVTEGELSLVQRKSLEFGCSGMFVAIRVGLIFMNIREWSMWNNVNTVGLDLISRTDFTQLITKTAVALRYPIFFTVLYTTFARTRIL